MASGALLLKLIAWSQGREGKNLCIFSSLNTEVYLLYTSGSSTFEGLDLACMARSVAMLWLVHSSSSWGNNCLLFSLISLLSHWLDTLTCYGEVLLIEGAFFPLEAGLEGCQPWIPQYETFSPDVGDQESHLPLFLVSDYIEINISGDTSCSVLRVIDIEQLLWFVQQGHPQA